MVAAPAEQMDLALSAYWCDDGRPAYGLVFFFGPSIARKDCSASSKATRWICFSRDSVRCLSLSTTPRSDGDLLMGMTPSSSYGGSFESMQCNRFCIVGRGVE